MENRIKEYRKQHKITQDELAKAVDVTRQTIISLENGKYFYTGMPVFFSFVISCTSFKFK